MCGLVGILKRNGQLGSEIKPILRIMGNQISYRGPDDEQLFSNNYFGAMFKRLSIVDVNGGSQPFFNKDKSIVLLVNGEIYNHNYLKASLKFQHQFKTKSDCEIILHLYEEKGIKFLDDLNGMFAFALWDNNKKRLILGRDRLGIKPLYYTKSNERLLFASEMKALFPYPDCPREFDWSAGLGHQFRLISQDNNLPTFFKDIDAVPAGSMLIIDTHTYESKIEYYWKPTFLSTEEYLSDTRTEQQIIDGYRDLLEDSVSIRLMADVEIGLFLSGGIDSVSIAALAAPHQKIHTFSVLSQSTFQNGDAESGDYASKYLNLPNHQVLFPWHDNPFTSKHWKDLLWLCETPLFNAEQLYKYNLHRYAKNLRPNLKVMLLGQGSDEFNGGYSVDYVDEYQPNLSSKEKNWSSFVNILADFEKDALISISNPNFSQYGGIIKKEYLSTLSNKKCYDHPWQYYINMHLQEIQTYNLWHEDRTASGNSIENRVPFLDHRLVEYCINVPPKKYESMFWDKNILRRAMKNIVPSKLAQRPKCPFFYGKDENYTHRMTYELLTANNNSLIEEAFFETDNLPIDKQTIEKLIKSIPNDPEYSLLESILPIVNMGLLSNMVRSPIHIDRDNIDVLTEIKIQKWGEQEADLSLNLTRFNQHHLLYKKVKFAKNIKLVRLDNNSVSMNDYSYVLVNNRVKYKLSEYEMSDWLMVLREVDGLSSINEIINKLEIKLENIYKYFEEAIDYKIITFIETYEKRKYS